MIFVPIFIEDLPVTGCIQVFWDVTLCCEVGGSQCLMPWSPLVFRVKQAETHGPMKSLCSLEMWGTTIAVYSVTSQNTVVETPDSSLSIIISKLTVGEKQTCW